MVTKHIKAASCPTTGNSIILYRRKKRCTMSPCHSLLLNLLLLNNAVVSERSVAYLKSLKTIESRPHIRVVERGTRA
jgi:hypothetical protein